MTTIQAPPVDEAPGAGLWPYVQIARMDHWFKNSFMVLGVVLALFYQPSLFSAASLPPLALALLATCLVASSNYVLNELLDAGHDVAHPEKRHRPVPSGRISLALGYARMDRARSDRVGAAGDPDQQVLRGLGAVAVGDGLLYNISPVRSKDRPYVDVFCESVNNPIRLLLGLFALLNAGGAPLAAQSSWMVGAYFMAIKRFAEFRHIGDRRRGGVPEVVQYYTE